MQGLDNVIDNQGFYDFVNHFISGSIFILGAEIVAKVFGHSLISIGYTFIGLLPVSGINEFIWNVCAILLFALTSFLIGVTAQELYDALYEHTYISEEKADSASHGDIRSTGSGGDKNSQKKCTATKVKLVASRLFRKTTVHKCLTKLFDSKDILSNMSKQKRYETFVIDFVNEFQLATDSVDGKPNYKPADGKPDYEYISYFYTYCEYYIHIKKLNKKTEKLRDIEGLSQELSLLFLILTLFSTVLALTSIFCFDIYKTAFLFVLTLLYGFLSIVMDLRTERSIKNRIRMTFALYDAAQMML